jgi:hypothetical protein
MKKLKIKKNLIFIFQTSLYIDDRVVRMKFTRDRRDRDLIRLDKGMNLVSQWHFGCLYGLGMG